MGLGKASFLLDDAAQASAEMLIILAALIAVAVVLVVQLQNTAEKASNAADSKVDKAIDELNKIK